MLDIGWTKLVLIAVAAIVFIGPRELPETLRGLGRMLAKLRRMAGEFQGQFNQALREANLDEVKREFDNLRQSTSVLRSGFNPVEIARNEIKDAVTGSNAATPSAMIDPALTSSAAVGAAAPAPVAEEPAEPIPSAFATAAAFKRHSA